MTLFAWKEAIPPRGPTGNTQTLTFIVRVAKFASSSSESAWPFGYIYCPCVPSLFSY